MRHKYDTRGIILTRAPLGEVSTSVTVLSPLLGVVRARAQGLRRSGAKLGSGLVTFAESALILMRGTEGWRITGAVLEGNWSRKLSPAARTRAARVSGLLLRLAPEGMNDSALFPLFRGFLEALSELSEELHESAEILAALSMLSTLGLDAGPLPAEGYAPSALLSIEKDKASYIARINRGIAASEL